MIENLTAFFKSKTFLMLAVIFVVGTVLLVFGKLTGNLWVDLCGWLTGGGAIRGSVPHFLNGVGNAKAAINKKLDSDSDDELGAELSNRTGKAE